MIIDLHTHILPPDWPNLRERYGYGGFVQLEHMGPGCARILKAPISAANAGSATNFLRRFARFVALILVKIFQE